MTALSEQLIHADLPRSPLPESDRCVAVYWEISRPAIHAVRPDLIQAAASPAPVLLEWRIGLSDVDGVKAQASLFDPTWNRRVPLLSTSRDLFRSDEQPTWIEDNSILHIDIPGLLMLSIRRDDRSDAVLYARTSVLAMLGLPGGRYEPASLVHRSPAA